MDWTSAELIPSAPPWIETQEEWAEWVDGRIMEGLMEEEAPSPEVCPICRSYMNEDAICDFCGFGKDEELYDAIKRAENIHEAFSEY